MAMIDGVLGLTVDGHWRWKEHSLNDVLEKDPRSASVDDLSRLS